MNQERLQQVLQQKSVKLSDSDCWRWMGQVSNSGRGRLMIKADDGATRTVSACDASYMAYIGEIPEGKLVNVKCGNSLCINPDHLILMDSAF